MSRETKGLLFTIIPVVICFALIVLPTPLWITVPAFAFGMLWLFFAHCIFDRLLPEFVKKTEKVKNTTKDCGCGCGCNVVSLDKEREKRR